MITWVYEYNDDEHSAEYGGIPVDTVMLEVVTLCLTCVTTDTKGWMKATDRSQNHHNMEPVRALQGLP